MTFISSYCLIRNYQLISNHQLIFDAKNLLPEQFLEQAYDHLRMDYPKFYKMDYLSQLGILATGILLKERNIATEYGADQVAVILSNQHASLDTDLRYFKTTKAIASPALFVYTLPNIVIGEICIKYGIKGEHSFFVFDNFNADFLCSYVDDLLNRNAAGACIAGWADVLGKQHDVFLYLVEREKKDHTIIHLPEILKKLYLGDYGTIDG